MAGAHVIDVTEKTFQNDVLQRSMKTPVLVDFWATWCGPCKTLGPQLETLAEEYRGAFVLAKIDVDKEQRLAAMFGIQSIPTVALLYQGQPIDSFAGALPMTELRQFLDSNLDRLGLAAPEPEGPPSDPEQAGAYWQAKLAANKDDSQARLELGRLLVAQGEVEAARSYLEAIEAAQPEYNAAQAALATMDLATQVTEAGGEAAVRAQLEQRPDDARARYLVACADAAKGRLVAALETLVALVGSAPADVKADARKAASVVFEAAGRDNPEIEALRRKLARLLF